jgi:hypothetical protein
MRWAATSAVTLAVALVLSGCGGSTPVTSTAPPPKVVPIAPIAYRGRTPEQILALSAKAVRSASTVHVKGDFIAGSLDVPVAVDVLLTRTGNASGTLTQQGHTLSVRLVSGTLYLRGDKGMWLFARAKGATQLSDRWIKVTSSTKNVILRGFLQAWQQMSIAELAAEMRPASRLERIDGKQLLGQQTVGLRDRGGDDPTIYYVAAKGAAFPLMIISTDKSTTVTLSEWNKKVRITAPTGPFAARATVAPLFTA